MTNIETIVRPFQIRDVTPPVAYIGTTTPKSTANATLICGKSGNGKSLGGSSSGTKTYYMDAKHKEKKRTVQDVRVTNPDDSSQFVDVAQTQKLHITGPNGQKSEYDLTGNQKNSTPIGAPYDITSK